MTTKNKLIVLACFLGMGYACYQYNAHTSTPDFQRRSEIAKCQRNPNYATDTYCSGLLGRNWQHHLKKGWQ